MVKLISNGRFFYAGANRELDEEFEAEEKDVALLTHPSSPRARKPEAAEAKPTAVAPMSTKDAGLEPAPKRKYQRRDMTAAKE